MVADQSTTFSERPKFLNLSAKPNEFLSIHFRFLQFAQHFLVSGFDRLAAHLPLRSHRSKLKICCFYFPFGEDRLAEADERR